MTKVGWFLKLGPHHTMQRMGVTVGALGLVGAIALGSAGVSAATIDQGTYADTALWTPKFTTSKTQLGGEVDGVFTSADGTKALVMMHFDDRAKISYNATDYEAFLSGSKKDLSSERLATPGITGSFQVFGSTGYVGMLLESPEPFKQQVINMTIRANAELTFNQQQANGESAEDTFGDPSFQKFDQWRIYANPGATGVTKIAALDAPVFDPAVAYYETVLQAEETVARDALESKLGEMRTNLTQITSYSEDLATTKVDGLFLQLPVVPSSIGGDTITGESATEADSGTSSLTLVAAETTPGGYAFDWRSGNVATGYLNQLVPEGGSYIEYLQQKSMETSTATQDGLKNLTWVLSNGKSLTTDYRTSDVTMRPLTTAMNNLAQAYQDYAKNKAEYQSDLMLDLLSLEVELRDVRANSTANTGEESLFTYY